MRKHARIAQLLMLASQIVSPATAVLAQERACQDPGNRRTCLMIMFGGRGGDRCRKVPQKVAAAEAVATGPSLHDLIVRLRPYIKTTRNGGHGETIRPASWRWFLSRSSMVVSYWPTQDANCNNHGTDDTWPNGLVLLRPLSDGLGLMDHNYLALHPDAILLPPDADVRQSSTTKSTPARESYALHLDDQGSSAQGEPWSSVVATGDGIYAHAEEILDGSGNKTGLVNIEYTILWPYNAGLCSYHHGDITTMTVVFDRKSDLITRLSYSQHGGELQEFQIAPAPQTRIVTLHGEDDEGNPQTIRAAQVVMQTYLAAGDEYFTPGDMYIYLAQDPNTGRFEHPAAYVEYNSHELWPNPGSSEYTVASHEGDGFSFLASETLEDLGTVDHPNCDDAPFLFFNGAWGTDPRSIMQHNSWYWPKGVQYGINNQTDPSPYNIERTKFHTFFEDGAGITWPPNPAYSDPTSAVQHVDQHALPDRFSLFNDQTRPFPDLNSALSFMPSGGTLVFHGGNIPAPLMLDRPGTYRAQAPVTLGR